MVNHGEAAIIGIHYGHCGIYHASVQCTGLYFQLGHKISRFKHNWYCYTWRWAQYCPQILSVGIPVRGQIPGNKKRFPGSLSLKKNVPDNGIHTFTMSDAVDSSTNAVG
jgi:hypothetical protein